MMINLTCATIQSLSKPAPISNFRFTEYLKAQISVPWVRASELTRKERRLWGPAHQIQFCRILT